MTLSRIQKKSIFWAWLPNLRQEKVTMIRDETPILKCICMVIYKN